MLKVKRVFILHKDCSIPAVKCFHKNYQKVEHTDYAVGQWDCFYQFMKCIQRQSLSYLPNPQSVSETQMILGGFWMFSLSCSVSLPHTGELSWGMPHKIQIWHLSEYVYVLSLRLSKTLKRRCVVLTCVWLQCGKQHVLLWHVRLLPRLYSFKCLVSNCSDLLKIGSSFFKSVVEVHHSVGLTFSSVRVCTVLSLVPPQAAGASFKSTWQVTEC